MTEPDERLLARSILCTDDPAEILARVDAHCRAAMDGAGVACINFVEISVGAAFGLTLEGARRVFLKAWSPATSHALLRDAHAVQAFLAARGYPCPGVLVEPRPFGDGHAAIHEYRDEGELRYANAPLLRRAMAAALARLVAMSEPLRTLPGLPRLVPRDGLWHAPHNALFDFEATRDGADWIERLAEASRSVILAAEGPAVIGHRDWSARNMRFRNGEVSIVYDWDSLAVEQEPVFVGKTAVAFPMTWYDDTERYPAPEAAAAFVRDYEAVRGRRFDEAERAVVAAAAIDALSYMARCEHARDPAAEAPAGSVREALRTYAPEVLAGLIAAG